MRTKKLKLDYAKQLDAINAATASVWGECLVLKGMWDYAHGYRTGAKLDTPCELWMDKKLSKSQPLHSQSIQEVRARYFKNHKGYRELRKNGHIKAKPPHKDKKYQTTTWKKSAIHFKGHLLILSNGKSGVSLKVRLPENFDLKYAISHIAIVELVYNNGQYSLHFVYNVGKPVKSKEKGIAGV